MALFFAEDQENKGGLQKIRIDEEKLSEKELQELLLSEMNLLPEKQKQALKLRVFGDLSFKEIS